MGDRVCFLLWLTLNIKTVNMKKIKPWIPFICMVLIPALLLITHCVLWIFNIRWFYYD